MEVRFQIDHSGLLLSSGSEQCCLRLACLYTVLLRIELRRLHVSQSGPLLLSASGNCRRRLVCLYAVPLGMELLRFPLPRPGPWPLNGRGSWHPVPPLAYLCIVYLRMATFHLRRLSGPLPLNGSGSWHRRPRRVRSLHRASPTMLGLRSLLVNLLLP